MLLEESDMEFPSFGDTDRYKTLATRCSEGISNGLSPFDVCYDSLRPIGSAIYFSIGHILNLDIVEYSYFYMILNIIWLFLLIFSTYNIILIAFKNSKIEIPKNIILIVVVGFSIVLFGGHVPVLLADLPAFSIFSFSSFILLKYERYILAHFGYGTLVGFAMLIKQNALLIGFIFYLVVILYRLRCFNFGKIRVLIKRSLITLLGVLSFTSIQVYNIYLKTGDLFLYDKEARAKYVVHPNQYELVAYNIPMKSAYLATVSNEVSPLFIKVLKFYKGMFQFEVPIYIGDYRNGSSPPNKSYEDKERIYIYIVSLCFVFISLVISKFRKLSLLVIPNLAYSILIPLTQHTEIRYYSYPKVVLFSTVVIFFIYLIFKLWNKKCGLYQS